MGKNINKTQTQSAITPLGIPTTVGELKKLIEKYPDDISFGFMNQPIQELCEYKGGGNVFVVFKEI